MVIGFGITCVANASTHQPPMESDICPVQHNQSAELLSVFDGTPEEMADLVPDKSGEHEGYWDLAYVYEAGRFVTVRCKYPDKSFYDIKLDKKVTRCNYAINAKKKISIFCR